MKREYTRPDIYFDSFSMTSSIANTCEVQATYAENICGVRMTESVTLFVSGITDCTFEVQDGEYDTLCYHVPADNYNVFNS